MRPCVLIAMFTFAGCAPQIGDSCDTALDCSLSGDRACDTSTPNGECTLFGCEAGACPGEAICVRFRPNDARLQFTACMKRCQERGNCRVDEGYSCVAAEDIIDSSTGEILAEIPDGEEDSMFCAATDPDAE